jgi:hypothetical protein
VMGVFSGETTESTDKITIPVCSSPPKITDITTMLDASCHQETLVYE